MWLFAPDIIPHIQHGSSICNFDFSICSNAERSPLYARLNQHTSNIGVQYVSHTVHFVFLLKVKVSCF